MKFKEFFSKCSFELIELGDSNWDYYTMQYKDEPPSVVALAKPGTGASDCFFGDMDYFKKWQRRKHYGSKPL